MLMALMLMMVIVMIMLVMIMALQLLLTKINMNDDNIYKTLGWYGMDGKYEESLMMVVTFS